MGIRVESVRGYLVEACLGRLYNIYCIRLLNIFVYLYDILFMSTMMFRYVIKCILCSIYILYMRGI